jgi:hypothetical protein
VGLGRWALTTVAVACGPPAVEAPPADHFSSFPLATRAVALGDVDGARTAARGLRGGAVPGDEAAAVGAAAGFLLVADDEERVDALLGVARACRGCHGGSPPAPAPTHDGLVDAAVYAVVFRSERPAAVIPEGTWRDPLAAAWASSRDPEARARSVLEACAGCHRPGSSLGEAVDPL